MTPEFKPISKRAYSLLRKTALRLSSCASSVITITLKIQ